MQLAIAIYKGIIQYDYTTKIDTDFVAETASSIAMLMVGLIAAYIMAGVEIPAVSDLLAEYEESLSDLLKNMF